MKTIENLQITKFFDVKTPVGISQRGEDLTNYSIGVDLYMPKFTEKFLQALKDVNKKLYPNLNYQKHYISDTIKEPEYCDQILICNGDELVAEINYYPTLRNDNNEIIRYSETNGKITFFSMLQIPTGIGMLIPNWVWCEVRTKSSNFQNGFTEVHGTVDMNYTYGVGVQICPSDELQIVTNEKFSQLVFHEAVPVMEITVVSQKDWNTIDEVIYKREKRTGGFGSTGKFDEQSTNDFGPEEFIENFVPAK